jgi:hypothetical protein
MTKQELIAKCYKELGLDPEKNPQSAQQIYLMMMRSGAVFPSEAISAVFKLMMAYIDQEEG